MDANDVLTLYIPGDIRLMLNRTPEELGRDVRLYAALMLFWHGKEFSILKFRTMYERPESYLGDKITAEDDPRITPLGNPPTGAGWLRDTTLNELSQLWNVLVGEMSLVGPRPEGPDLPQTWPEAEHLLSVHRSLTTNHCFLPPIPIRYRNKYALFFPPICPA